MATKKLSNFSSASAFSEIYETTDFLKGYQKSFCEMHTYAPSDTGKNQKGNVFYNTHSYPTKIPVDNIVKRIQHHTTREQIVLDPFCGSGMTGLAAKLTGRDAYLSDLGTLALHLSSNHVANCDVQKMRKTAFEILEKLQVNSPYFIKVGRKELEVNYVLFAEIIKCPKCSKNLSTWEIAKKTKSFSVPTRLECSNCGQGFNKSGAKIAGKQPVQMSLLSSGSKSVTVECLKNLERTRQKKISSEKIEAIGSTPFLKNREMHIRSALHLQKVDCLRNFYSDTNWNALASLYSEINDVKDSRIRAVLMFAFTNTAWHGSKMRRYNSRGGHRPLTGTLYFPQLYSEGNCFRIFENKIETLTRYYNALSSVATNSEVILNRNSATNLIRVEDQSIDYIYTDPPFGSNIFYADCNFIAEAWLGSPTDTSSEAVVNKSLKTIDGGKDLDHYAKLMQQSFSEMRRVLKQSGEMSLVFNSSSGVVWQALMDSLNDAGLEVADAGLLDKVQLSVKGYKSKNAAENVATTDIVLGIRKRKKMSSQKPAKVFEEKVLKKAFKEFQKKDRGNPEFETTNFYSFLLKYCHLNGYSFEEISMSNVADFVRQAAEITA